MQVFFLTPETIDILENIGFTILLTLIIIGLLIYVIRSEDRRQKESLKRYETLLNNFIKEMDETSKKHDREVDKIVSELYVQREKKNLIDKAKNLTNRRHNPLFQLEEVTPVNSKKVN